MQKTFIVEVFALLTLEEVKELGLFLQSEMHNSDRFKTQVIQLYEYLRTRYPNFDNSPIKKDEVYDYLFPNSPVVFNKLEKVSSELHKIIKSYLLWKEMNNANNQFDLALKWADILRSKGAEEKYEQQMQKIKKQFLSDQPEVQARALQKLRFEEMNLKWSNIGNKEKDDPNVGNTLRALVSYFDHRRLDLANYHLLQQKVAYFEIDASIQKVLDLHLDHIYDDDSKMAFLSRKVNTLLKNDVPDLDSFEELLLSLQENEDNLEKEVLKNYFSYLRNICTLLINQGHDQLTPFLFSLFKDNLSRGYLYHNEKLHISTLMSLTRTAIATGNIEWASEFVQQHADKLFGDQDTKPYLNLNIALCKFKEGDYDEVLNLLSHTFSHATYHLMARRLEIMCYYETQSELFIYKLEAFKIFVWRASSKYLSDQLKEANNHFISSLTQLWNMKPNDSAKRQKLAQKIRGLKNVAESIWLLSKLE